MKPSIMSPQRVLSMLHNNQLDELRAYANEVLTEECAYARGDVELTRCREALKYIKKVDANLYPAYAGAFIVDGIQYMSNRATAFAFDEGHQIPGLPLPPSASSGYLDVEAYFRCTNNFPDTSEVTQAELRNVIAIWKTEGKPGKTVCLYKIGRIFYNAQYLLQTLQIMGVDKAELRQPESTVGISYFSTEGRRALICAAYGREEPHHAYYIQKVKV
jgi:hypothetical protein